MTASRLSINYLFLLKNFFFLKIGITSILLFYIDIFFSLGLSILIMFLITIYAFYQFQKKRIDFLIIFLLLIFLLPFIHMFPYLWFDFDSSPLNKFGMAINPYMLDQRVVQLTAMLGAVGAMGVASGISSVTVRNYSSITSSKKINYDFKTIGLGIWFIWFFVGILLSILSFPTDTLFLKSYTFANSFFTNASFNFDSSWLISYIILTFTTIDSIIEKKPQTKFLKSIFTIIGLLYVFIKTQFLTGNRECLPFIFGLFLAFFYWIPKFTNKSNKFYFFKIIIVVFLILTISLIVSNFRQNLEGTTRQEFFKISAQALIDQLEFDRIFTGTWTASLLTPLSVAGDHIYNLLELKKGKDYLDIFLSLPPGFISDLLNYERPISSQYSPAHEMRYGGGGVHALVLPFRNFSIFGVFFIPFLWTVFFLRLEKFAQKNISVSNLSLLVTIVLAGPHWMWYGEKVIINAIIIWFLLAFFFKLSTNLKFYKKT